VRLNRLGATGRAADQFNQPSVTPAAGSGAEGNTETRHRVMAAVG